jgi:hypothetical protein
MLGADARSTLSDRVWRRRMSAWGQSRRLHDAHEKSGSPPITDLATIGRDLPTEAALRIDGLYGQPEKMADGARLIRDFQPPLVTVSELRNGVADHVRACRCSLISGPGHEGSPTRKR